MKKYLALSVAALLSAASMTSCKKDYLCVCKSMGITTSTVINATQKDAQTDCDNQAKAAQANGVADASCKL